jgi:hypothetical protein
MEVNDDAGCLVARAAWAFFASRGSAQGFVGASLLAMVVNDDAGRLDARSEVPPLQVQ